MIAKSVIYVSLMSLPRTGPLSVCDPFMTFVIIILDTSRMSVTNSIFTDQTTLPTLLIPRFTTGHT